MRRVRCNECGRLRMPSYIFDTDQQVGDKPVCVDCMDAWELSGGLSNPVERREYARTIRALESEEPGYSRGFRRLLRHAATLVKAGAECS